MARYEFIEEQVQSLKAIILDANIKGSAAGVVVGLLAALDEPVDEVKPDDLRGEHNDTQGHGQDEP